MEEVPNLINICPTIPIQVLNLHDFFEDFVCVLQMTRLTKIKKYIGTSAPQQRQEVYSGQIKHR